MIILIEALLTTIRLLTGLVAIGIMPGYILTYRLFPSRTIDGLERFYLSTISSLAISSLVAFTLSQSNIGLSARSMAVSVLTVTILIGIFSGVSAYAVFIKLPYENIKQWFNQRRVVPPLIMGAFALFLVAFSATSNNLRNDQPGAITEFFIQPEYLTTEGIQYVRDEETLRIPVSIVNRGSAQITYRINWVTDDGGTTAHTLTLVSQHKQAPQTRSHDNTIRIDAGGTWSGILQVPATQLANADYIRINLYDTTTATAAAHLKIWLGP